MSRSTKVSELKAMTLRHIKVDAVLEYLMIFGFTKIWKLSFLQVFFFYFVNILHSVITEHFINFFTFWKTLNRDRSHTMISLTLIYFFIYFDFSRNFDFLINICCLLKNEALSTNDYFSCFYLSPQIVISCKKSDKTTTKCCFINCK